MVRWIQVGHDDLLHRSEGISGVSNLTCTPTQQTCQARKFPGLRAVGNAVMPRSLGYEERVGLKRDVEKLRGEVAHGGAGSPAPP